MYKTMIKNTIWLIILVVAITSCQQSSGDEVMGYKYEVFTNKGDRRPVEGDYVYFKLYIMDQNDSLLQEMSREPQLPVLKVLTPEEQKANPNPISELLKEISLGDSARLIMPIDSFDNFPMDKSQFDAIHYNVVITKVMSETEHQEYMGQKQAEELTKFSADKERLPEIEATVKEKLADYNNGNLELKEGPEGLQYHMIEEGTGPLPENNKMASVHYYGVLKNGDMFDTSFRMGRPYTFTVGRGEVIRGWDVGVPLVKEGGKALLVLPSTLAYGATGSPPNIGPNEDLVFYVEIDKVF